MVLRCYKVNSTWTLRRWWQCEARSQTWLHLNTVPIAYLTYTVVTKLHQLCICLSTHSRSQEQTVEQTRTQKTPIKRHRSSLHQSIQVRSTRTTPSQQISSNLPLQITTNSCTITTTVWLLQAVVLVQVLLLRTGTYKRDTLAGHPLLSNRRSLKVFLTTTPL